MIPPRSDLHTAWARLFVGTLASAGVRDVVISPGSRSTPLSLAAAQDARLRVHVVVDERDAAFFALGQARASGGPSALICTSGTAGAHYLPAAIEASHSHIPLLLITADRPWDAYDAAAPQTIDQVKLFGDAVRHYAELGLPDPAPAALAAAVRVAAQAVLHSRTPRPGPVHINARFRKPLEPVSVPGPEPFSDHIDVLWALGAPQLFPALPSVDPRAIDALAAACARSPRGLIVCGPAHCGDDPTALRDAVIGLSQATGFPIWAEATSGIRFGGSPFVCGAFDAFLRDAPTRKSLAPDLLIELGGPPTSSAYASYLQDHPGCLRAVVAPHGWNDPAGGARILIFSSPIDVCTRLAAHPALLHTPHAGSDWAPRIAAVEQRAWRCIDAAHDTTHPTEADVARTLVQALPHGATLLVGNSLPVRDLDTYCRPLPHDHAPRVLHQRGASGIDGLLAGAAGTRSVSTGPVALLLGDVSAQHDVGGMAALASVSGPLLVVIVQNGGGRIFEALPIGSAPQAQPHFARLFLTAGQIDFAHAAQSFGLDFARVHSSEDLQAAVQRGLTSDRPLIVEAVVPGAESARRRSDLWARIAAAQTDDSSTAIQGQAPPTSATPHRISVETAEVPSDVRVFWHGFLGGPASWRGVTDALAGQNRCDCLPGHGPDPWVAPNAGWNDVVDALAARLPDGKPHLIGYSQGARLALSVALRHPDRIAGLTLIGVDAGVADDGARLARVEWEDALAARLMTDSLSTFVDAWESLPLFATQRKLPRSVLAAQRAQRLQHSPAGLRWALQTLGTGRMPNLWPDLDRLTMPVRIITGELDEKFTHIGQQLAVRLPNASHIRCAHVGHNVVLEAPSRILDILRTPLHRTIDPAK